MGEHAQTASLPCYQKLPKLPGGPLLVCIVVVRVLFVCISSF